MEALVTSGKLILPQDIAAGYHFRFDVDALTRADAAARAEADSKAIRGGMKTPNEIRKRDHLPPKPNGDQLMIARDMIPLDVAVEHPELILGVGGAQPQGGENE